MELVYDVLILGGGPAGCTAALYTARAGLRTLVLEKLCPGGQMTLTNEIDNYPGFPQSVSGFILGDAMAQGARRFGAEVKLAEIRSVELTGNIKQAETSEGVFRGRAVILATGASPRRLNLPGEERLLGKGIHYCAACDGMAYKGKTVAVVGGGSSAVHEALILSRICRGVILIHRRDTLRAEDADCKALRQADHVRFRWNCAVAELLGQERLSGLRLRNLETGEFALLPCDALFVSIGRVPETALFRNQLELDEKGYVVSDESTRTNLPGVFAAGDLRTKEVRQIVTAAADGAAAAYEAGKYLSSHP